MRLRAVLPTCALLACGKKDISAGEDAGAKMSGHDFSCQQAPNVRARSATVAHGRLFVLDDAGGLNSYDPSFRSYRVHWERSGHVQILTGGNADFWALDAYQDQLRAYRFDPGGRVVAPFPRVVGPRNATVVGS